MLIQNQQSKAKKLIDQSLAKNSQNSYAHRNLGLYFLKNGEKSQALAALQKAYQLSPATDQIHVWLGEALFVNNQKEEACRVWKKGEALGEEDAVVKYKQNCK